MKRKRLRNLPTWFASAHVSPPSRVSLVKPPSKFLSPQPPTQPSCSSTKPMPSRLALPCGSSTGRRSQLCPPSTVLRIAPSTKFSSDTKPTSSVTNWIFQPHSPLGKSASMPARRFSPVWPPSLVASTTGVTSSRVGLATCALPPTTQPHCSLEKKVSTSSVACSPMSVAVQVSPPSTLLMTPVARSGKFVPDPYTTRSLTTLRPQIAGGASGGRLFTRVQVAPPSLV